MKKSIYSAEAEALRTLLIAGRKEQKITQQDIAKILDRPQSFIAKVESGERQLDVLEFISYVRALRLSPQKVFEKLLRTL